MSAKTVVKNMPGRNRPELSCDRLGYPASVGDKEWNKKHKHLWTEGPKGTWTKK